MSKTTKAVGVLAFSLGAAALGYHTTQDIGSNSLEGILLWSGLIGFSAWSGLQGKMEATTLDGSIISSEPPRYYHIALGVSATIGSIVGQALYYNR